MSRAEAAGDAPVESALGDVRGMLETGTRRRVAEREEAYCDESVSCLNQGFGASAAQHGEILQGQVRSSDNRLHRFLVSLPCTPLQSWVTFTPVPAARLSVVPSHKSKVIRVIELTLRRFGRTHQGGRILVESNIAESKGYGSSTADCVAAVRAAAHACRSRLREQEVAELVVEAEIASDNFMFRRPVLFAHREAMILEELGPCLPRLEVLGIDTDARGLVNTLEFSPAAYDRSQVEFFQSLVSTLRQAVQTGNGALLGRVATASAIMNQEYLPKPMFAEIRAIADHAEAFGVAVAHSGTVMSILLNPCDPRLEATISSIRKDLAQLGISDVLRFTT
jgi:uncharacterized protein involved in propanediol utilization